MLMLLVQGPHFEKPLIWAISLGNQTFANTRSLLVQTINSMEALEDMTV